MSTSAVAQRPFSVLLSASNPMPPCLLALHCCRPYLLSQQLSDITLVVHDQQLPAHRLVLAACTRFADMMGDQSKTKPVDRKWKVCGPPQSWTGAGEPQRRCQVACRQHGGWHWARGLSDPTPQ